MSAETGLIPLVVLILGLGVVAQVFADRLEIPSVMLLILAGIAVGPEGLGLVTAETFGDSLSAIVGLSVAIIVFEGAFHLTREKLRQSPREAFRLGTVGAMLNLVGTALVVRFALGASWDVSLLIGALLVATGPTVITPILDVVAVRDRVAAVLETEGIVNDVTAAILAVVTFEVLVIGEAGAPTLVRSFVTRLGVGLLVGIVVATVLWYLLSHTDLSTDNAVRNSRLLVLVGALSAYGIADSVATEAGIAAVATAGVLLGNADLPYEDEIAAFKGDVTLVVLSFVFVALATLLSFEDLLALGVGGAVVVATVIVVVRPLLVFVSTLGGRFTFRERVFVSAVGPRGIIPASVATLFAVELDTLATERRIEAAATSGTEARELLAQAATFEQQSQLLVGTVFLVILATVVLQGGFARHIAEALDVIPMRVIVVGGGRVGRGLATRLDDRGENVVIIEQDQDRVETTRGRGFTVHHGDGTDTGVLRDAGADNAKIIAAATGDDDANLLVAQLAHSNFDVETVIARVNQPRNVDAFEDLGVTAISANESVAWAMDNAIERPALSNWMTELGRQGDVQEIEVTAEDLVGKSIGELDQQLPEGVLIALVGRDGETRMPDPDFTLRFGDHLTFLGRKEAVRTAIERCHPEMGT